LEEYARRQRGDRKVHPSERARVGLPEKGYGFLETADGRQIYFHKNSVLGGSFGRIETAPQSRSEETGEHGPQATSVKLT